MSIVMFGLTAQEHLSFKGVPLEGSVSEFCRKLTEKGFTKVGSDQNIVSFTGEFTGRDVVVSVGGTPDGNNVYAVVVLFKESGEWNTLVNTYDYYKELYERKYGEPSASKEDNPGYRDDNFTKMHALYEGRVTWESDWSVAGGSIELFISKFGAGMKGAVVIRYTDAQNIEAKISSALEDI